MAGLIEIRVPDLGDDGALDAGVQPEAAERVDQAVDHPVGLRAARHVHRRGDVLHMGVGPDGAELRRRCIGRHGVGRLEGRDAPGGEAEQERDEDQPGAAARPPDGRAPGGS